MHQIGKEGVFVDKLRISLHCSENPIKMTYSYVYKTSSYSVNRVVNFLHIVKYNKRCPCVTSTKNAGYNKTYLSTRNTALKNYKA